jgi:hypothetical protein
MTDNNDLMIGPTGLHNDPKGALITEMAPGLQYPLVSVIVCAVAAFAPISYVPAHQYTQNNGCYVSLDTNPNDESNIYYFRSSEENTIFMPDEVVHMHDLKAVADLIDVKIENAKKEVLLAIHRDHTVTVRWIIGTCLTVALIIIGILKIFP